MGWKGMGIDCTMRILDGWKQIARLFAWEVGVNGVVVGDLGLVRFLVFFFGFSTGAGGFVVLVLSIRRFDAATLGLDWTFLVHIPACVRLLFFLSRDIRRDIEVFDFRCTYCVCGST
jgi:hypothetical protein